MAEWVKVLASNSGEVSLIPTVHLVERANLLMNVFFFLPQRLLTVFCPTKIPPNLYPHTHQQM